MGCDSDLSLENMDLNHAYPKLEDYSGFYPKDEKTEKDLR